MFPDLIDKPVRWILAITPNDRIPAHTAIGWAATTWLARRLAGPTFAGGWAVGYAAHLWCDQINAYLNPGRIYLWWPLRRYRLHTGPTGLGSSLGDFGHASLLAEAGMVVLAAVAWLMGRRHGPGRGVLGLRDVPD